MGPSSDRTSAVARDARTAARAWCVLAAAWAPAVAGLAYVSASHAGGSASTAPPEVAMAALHPSSDPLSISVWIHPSCPCTARTLDLLAGMVDERPGLAVQLFVTVPAAEDAERLPAAEEDPSRGGRFEVRLDPGGALAAGHGAERSGHAMVTAADGRVLFSGGVVTGGHRTSSNRGAALAALEGLDGLTAADRPATAPVYGCPLVLDAEGVAR